MIPSAFHLIDRPLYDLLRVVIGLIFSIIVLAFFYVLSLIKIDNFLLVGIIVSSLGLFEAIGGSWKDAPFEGFDRLKFFRSPVTAISTGLLLFYFFRIENGLILFLVTHGLMRMIIELKKAFLSDRYHPGKFKTGSLIDENLLEKRKILMPTYVFTWIVFGVLFLIALKNASPNLF